MVPFWILVGLLPLQYLLKFKPGTDLDAVEASVRKTYEKLDQLLPFLNNPVVCRNCVDRDSNADLMAVVQLDSSEQLNDYLMHPLHIQMAPEGNHYYRIHWNSFSGHPGLYDCPLPSCPKNELKYCP